MIYPFFRLKWCVEGLWITPFLSERPQTFFCSTALFEDQKRGPASRCCQSTGIPPSSTGPPPPQRRPFIVMILPQIAFMIRVGPKPRLMSTPVEGHDR